MDSKSTRFRQGERVRVAPRPALERFVQTWKYHHPLQPEQLAFAEATTSVAWIGDYHGGNILYQLEGIPGIWHECLLEAA